VSNIFDQLDGAIARKESPGLGFRATPFGAVRAERFGRLPGGYLGDSGLLQHLAEPLSALMGVRLNLVVVRNSRPLLDSLNLGSNLGSLLEQIRQFFFQGGLFRVHAISPKGYRGKSTPPILTCETAILLLTFSEHNSLRNP